MSKLDSIELFTEHLVLVAATFEYVSAEIDSINSLASLLDTKIEEGWPPGEYDRGAQEFFKERLQQEGASSVGWYTWYAIRRFSESRSSVLIGACGYFGPPNKEHEVEIGFSVMPSWQKCGYATEMSQALIKNAFADSRVNKVIAHTTATNTASLKVLKKCQFVYVGENQENKTQRFEILKNSIA